MALWAASINVGLGQCEGVAQQLNARRGAFRDDNLDNVETKKNVGIIQETEPREAPAGNSFLLVTVDGVERSSEILARPRFHFDEDEGVFDATDNVDFAAAPAAKITIEDFVAAPP
jgi:hypothetical protein